VTRRSELEAIRESVLLEIYRLCVELGLDPEALDVNLYATNDPRAGMQGTFGAHCYKLQVIERQLEET